MKTLIFDLYGEWGHFRTFYTTTSPLTFSVIPPTAVFGIIGAILGLSKDKNEYLKILRDSKTNIAIALKDKVRKTRLGINLVDTKQHFWIIHNRTQIRTEFLRNARFRLFVSIENDNLFDTLTERVKAHKTYYTLSLGLSELLADFKYVDLLDFHINTENNEYKEIHSIIPINSLPEEKGISIEQGKWYKKEMLPIDMDEQRIVHNYGECLIEMKGTPIKAKPKTFWTDRDNKYNIIFLNEYNK